MSSCISFTTKTIENYQVITTLLTWTHRSCQQPAHCLVRVFTPHTRLDFSTIVLSELRSNDRRTQMASDFGTIADALWSCLKQQGVSVNLDTLTWLAHYGNFSSFEALSPETFLMVHLHQINGQFQETAPETILLNMQDFTPCISKLPLEPVFEVLHQLGWTAHNL